jgi:hypothetical protein
MLGGAVKQAGIATVATTQRFDWIDIPMKKLA